MDGLQLKEDIIKIKQRLDNVETELKTQIADLAVKEEIWKEMDSKADGIRKTHDDIVKFNVCGKKFATKMETLLGIKDTLFYKMIISGVNMSEELIFDRDPKWFNVVLDYLRKKTINYKRYDKKQLKQLRSEAVYFELTEILEYLEENAQEIHFVGYEFSGPYTSSNVIVGTNNIDDITDRTLMKGICANSPGWIIVELNKTHEINQLEVGGYAGNSSYWSCENGAYATIEVSEDKSNWSTVGTIPSGYGSAPKIITFMSKSARYIKFSYSSYVGIGYLNVSKA